MSSARIAVTAIIVVLVAFVVAVPVLSALFSDGGSFEQLEEVVTGTESSVPTTISAAECEFSRGTFSPPSALIGNVQFSTAPGVNSSPTETGVTSPIQIQLLPPSGIKMPVGTRPHGVTLTTPIDLTVSGGTQRINTVFYIRDPNNLTRTYITAFAGLLTTPGPLSSHPYRMQACGAGPPATDISANSITGLAAPVTTTPAGCFFRATSGFSTPSGLTGAKTVLTSGTNTTPTEASVRVSGSVTLTALPSSAPGVRQIVGDQPHGVALSTPINLTSGRVETIFYVLSGSTRYIVAYAGSLTTATPLATHPFRHAQCSSSPATNVAAGSLTGQAATVTTAAGCVFTPTGFTTPSALTGSRAILTSGTNTTPTESGLTSPVTLSALPSGGVRVAVGARPDGVALSTAITVAGGTVETIFYVRDGSNRYIVAYAGSLTSASTLANHPFRHPACASSTNRAVNTFTGLAAGTTGTCTYSRGTYPATRNAGNNYGYTASPYNFAGGLLPPHGLFTGGTVTVRYGGGVGTPLTLTEMSASTRLQLNHGQNLTIQTGVVGFASTVPAVASASRVAYITQGSTNYLVAWGYSASHVNSYHCSATLSAQTAQVTGISIGRPTITVTAGTSQAGGNSVSRYSAGSTITQAAANSVQAYASAVTRTFIGGNAVARYVAAVIGSITRGEPTALTGTTYAPIMLAILGLIPLGLLLAVGWYFVGQRMMSGRGGGRRRGGRRR